VSPKRGWSSGSVSPRNNGDYYEVLLLLSSRSPSADVARAVDLRSAEFWCWVTEVGSKVRVMEIQPDSQAS
jgi:hypothetical protein